MTDRELSTDDASAALTDTLRRKLAPASCSRCRHWKRKTQTTGTCWINGGPATTGEQFVCGSFRPKVAHVIAHDGFAGLAKELQQSFAPVNQFEACLPENYEEKTSLHHHLIDVVGASLDLLDTTIEMLRSVEWIDGRCHFCGGLNEDHLGSGHRADCLYVLVVERQGVPVKESCDDN